MASNKNKKVTFSAVTITKNEAKRLGKFLESVKWCDEIIVVDDESTDKTCEIARKYGAKVIQRKKGTLAEQWRFALAQAKMDWVLWGGADQWFSKASVRDIRKRAGKEKYVGYLSKFQEFFLGTSLKVKDDPSYMSLWVVEREAMIVPEVEIHQYIEADGPVGVLRGVIYHDSFRSFEQIINKFNYYTTLQAQEAYVQGKRTSVSRILLGPVYLFFWRMIKLKEYRDGVLGLWISLVMALDKLFFHLKLWELGYKDQKKPLKERRLSHTWYSLYGWVMRVRWTLSRYDHEGALIARMVPGWKRLKILDIGSGPGNIASDPRFAELEVVCVDASRRAVEECKRKGLAALYLDVKDISKRFSPNSVDIVWCLDVLEHLKKPEALQTLFSLEQIARKEIVVFVPLGYFPQDREPKGILNPEFIQHRSAWQVDDFKKLGYQCDVLGGFHWDIRMYCSSLAHLTHPVVRDAMWAVKRL